MTTPHPQSLSPLRGEGSQGRRCRASWALGLRATRCRSSASLRWWTKSRCDSVCLRSRHFVARLRRGLAHDAIAIQTTRLSKGFNRRNLPATRLTLGGRARHSVRAAIGIQADKLSWLPLSHRFTFKKNIMQVTFCKPVTLAAKAPKMPGRVATGFPLPSTGRGIEGEGWSYPERPPVRFFLYQHHPPSKLNT